MFLTSDDRRALIEADWMVVAVDYMVELRMYEDTPDDRKQAFELAETLWEGSDNDDTDFPQITPQDAVDEELTYWGD